MSRRAKDLVVLVADADMEAALRGLLSRPEALGVRPLKYDVFRHPGRDPGCRAEAHVFLRQFRDQYDHALVVFDHHGSGREPADPTTLQEDLVRRLSADWQDRAAALVITPELEIWVWSDSPQVDQSLGWSGRMPNLRSWLVEQGLWDEGNAKPNDPKRALAEALHEVRKPRSPSIFDALARTVSVNRCRDAAFLLLRSLLRAWVPADPDT